MSDHSNIQEFRQSILHQLNQSKQVIEGLTDEELDAIAGGGAFPNWSNTVNSKAFSAYKNGIKEGAERAGKKWNVKSLAAGTTGGAVAGSAITLSVSSQKAGAGA